MAEGPVAIFAGANHFFVFFLGGGFGGAIEGGALMSVGVCSSCLVWVCLVHMYVYACMSVCLYVYACMCPCMRICVYVC